MYLKEGTAQLQQQHPEEDQKQKQCQQELPAQLILDIDISQQQLYKKQTIDNRCQRQIPPLLSTRKIITGTATLKSTIKTTGTVISSNSTLITNFPLSSLNSESAPEYENNEKPHNNDVSIDVSSFTLSPNSNVNKYLPNADSNEVPLELVMPAIYLSKDFTYWNMERLHSCQCTHIIIIDKHIQESYRPATEATNHNHVEQTDQQSHFISDAVDVLDEDDYDRSKMLIMKSSFNFGADFQVINLNFGEKTYLANVLPNCYKAVKFMDKALENNGKIIVIDCNGGEQKCLTIIVAYLMFKYNIKFRAAFARVKDFYHKADLDRFYISQLYEYEPIVQVQRAQLRGHSCSRIQHAAILKRKYKNDECEENFMNIRNNTVNSEIISNHNNNAISVCTGDGKDSGDVITTTNGNASDSYLTTHLIDNCLSSLNNFKASQMRKRHFKYHSAYNECNNVYNGLSGARKTGDGDDGCKTSEMLDLGEMVTAVTHLTGTNDINSKRNQMNGVHNCSAREILVGGNNYDWNDWTDDCFME